MTFSSYFEGAEQIDRHAEVVSMIDNDRCNYNSKTLEHGIIVALERAMYENTPRLLACIVDVKTRAMKVEQLYFEGKPSEEKIQLAQEVNSKEMYEVRLKNPAERSALDWTALGEEVPDKQMLIMPGQSLSNIIRTFTSSYSIDKLTGTTEEGLKSLYDLWINLAGEQADSLLKVDDSMRYMERQFKFFMNEYIQTGEITKKNMEI